MDIYFHILNNEGVIISSNLPLDYSLNSNHNLVNKIKIEKDPNTGIEYRHGFFINSTGSVYLASTDKNITNRIFNRYFDSCFFFLPHLIEKEREFREKEQQNFRRLKHNLITHNTNILQELEKNFPLEKLPKGGKKQIEYIKSTIERNSNTIAISQLKILRSANLMKSDFDVYDMLVAKNKPYLEFDNHNIHKIILQVLNPFWLEFVEKEIYIDINDCYETVFMDYKSISVVFTHLFENAVKYTAPNTTLKISFEDDKDNLVVCIEMTSLKITQNDSNRIYDNSYSGEYATKLGKNGSGLGMNVVKQLLLFNKAEIKIDININPSENVTIHNIPFEKNLFYIKFPKNRV